MGLLDSILGGATGQSQGNQSTAILIQLALQMLAGGNARGGGGGGGGSALDGLIRQFEQAGLGNQMNSWIGTGQNMPLSPDQLTNVLGPRRMEEMAASSGLDVDQVSNGLSDLLPQLIDRVTPQGRVPDEGLDSALAELSRMVPR
jgi:uncharacterized protein YidB (DUF937 family)